MVQLEWSLLGPPVDIGANFQQGMKMGQAMVAKRRQENALKAYMTNPDDVTARNALAVEDPDMVYKLEQTRALRAKTQADTQSASLDANRERIMRGAQIIRQVQPKDDAGWQQVRSLAQRDGIDLTDVPETFDPAYVEGMVKYADTFEPVKPQAAGPASIQEYEYAKKQGFNGDYMAFMDTKAGPLIANNGDGTFTVAPRPRFAPGGPAPVVPQSSDPLAPQPSAGMPTEPPVAGKVRIPAYAQMSSGFRSPEHNRNVGGVENSYHTKRGPDGQPLGRDYVPTAGKSMAQLFVDLKTANPHLEVINEGDHVHVEPRSGQAAAPKLTAEQLAERAIARGADPAKVRARLAQLGGR